MRILTRVVTSIALAAAVVGMSPNQAQAMSYVGCPDGMEVTINDQAGQGTYGDNGWNSGWSGGINMGIYSGYGTKISSGAFEDTYMFYAFDILSGQFKSGTYTVSTAECGMNFLLHVLGFDYDLLMGNIVVN